LRSFPLRTHRKRLGLANRSIANPKNLNGRLSEVQRKLTARSWQHAALVVWKVVVTGAAGLAVRATNLGADARCARREPAAATAADGEVATVEVALCAAHIDATSSAAIASGNSAGSGSGAAASGKSSARASSRSSSATFAAASRRSSSRARRGSAIARAASNDPVTGRSGSPAARGCAGSSTAEHAARSSIARRRTCRPAAMRCARGARAGSSTAGLVRAARREPNR